MTDFEELFGKVPVVQVHRELDRKILTKTFSDNNWNPHEDYLDFLCWHNGLVVSPESIKLMGYRFRDRRAEPFVFGENGSAFSELYGINPNGDALVAHQNDYQFSRYAPHGTICIGGHAGLSQVALATAGDDLGSIYHWPIGRAYEDEPPASEWNRMVELVAPSFKEFLTELIPFDC